MILAGVRQTAVSASPDLGRRHGTLCSREKSLQSSGRMGLRLYAEEECLAKCSAAASCAALQHQAAVSAPPGRVPPLGDGSAGRATTGV